MLGIIVRRESLVNVVHVGGTFNWPITRRRRARVGECFYPRGTSRPVLVLFNRPRRLRYYNVQARESVGSLEVVASISARRTLVIARCLEHHFRPCCTVAQFDAPRESNIQRTVQLRYRSTIRCNFCQAISLPDCLVQPSCRLRRQAYLDETWTRRKLTRAEHRKR